MRLFFTPIYVAITGAVSPIGKCELPPKAFVMWWTTAAYSKKGDHQPLVSPGCVAGSRPIKKATDLRLPFSSYSRMPYEA